MRIFWKKQPTALDCSAIRQSIFDTPLCADAQAIAEQIRAQGAVLVRRCFDAAALSQIHARFEAALADLPHARLTPEEATLYAVSSTNNAASLYFVDQTASTMSALVAHSILPDIAMCYFGNTSTFLDLTLTRIRKVFAPAEWTGNYHGFHRDGVQVRYGNQAEAENNEVGRLNPRGMLTVWTSLVTLDAATPSLDVILGGRTDEFVEEPQKHWITRERRENAVTRHLLDCHPLWHPQPGLGDVVIFHERTFHRTHFQQGMSKPRTSIDFRFLADEPYETRGRGILYRREGEHLAATIAAEGQVQAYEG